VFCSEGSPAGFDTAQYTSATDNDAAEPIYNRLVEFERGGTAVQPALATAGRSPTTACATPSTCGRGEVPQQQGLQAQPRLQRRRRAVHLQPHARQGHPFRQAYPTEFPYFISMGLDKNIAKVEKTAR
jgi:dipeptide transport system substrate-binding protein